ncbi:hypothetical protein BC938DRAFT_481528 [Jimgerdemannia flammicorona]|uniref:Uncharacterized protein n=1 Tax=Jimgerdemannia flammicorona TaxID=994334 RepID=A0A433QFZ7_9FUNG|nr:hypothetical protein BC938DRAFT_481528 [Jimgerdemannia flammicorona]
MSDNDSLAIPPPTISGGAPKSLLFKNPKTSPLFQASSSSGSNAPAGDPAPSGIQGFKFAPTLKRPSQQQQQSSSIPSVVGQGSSSVALSIFGKPHFRSPKTNIFQAQLDPNAIESSNTSSTANDGGARSSEPSTGKSTLSFGFEPFPKPTVSTVIESASTSLASSGRPRSSSKPEAHSPAKRLFSNKKLALPTVDNTSPGQFVQQQPPPHSVAPEILQDSVPTPFLVAPSDDQAPGVLLPGMNQDPNHAAQEPEKSTQFSRPLSRSHLYAFKSLPDVSTSTPPSKTGLPLDLPTPPASAIPISSRYFISHQVPPSPVDTPPRTPSATRRQAMTPFPPPPSRIPIPQHSTTEEDVEDVIRGAVSKYKTQLKHKDETIKSMTTDRDELNNTICKKQAALEVFQERIQVMNSMLQRQAMKWEQNRKRIEGMKDRYDLYQSTLRHVDIAISDLQTDKERMFADLELSRGDHVALAAKYEAMVKEYHEGIAQKQSEITRLTSTQEELREYLQEARFKIKNLSKDVEEHGGNLARTTVERDQLRSELAQATSTHADLAQTHAVLLAGHVREVEQLKASIDVLDQACKRHQDETKQRDDRITAMASELAFLGGRLEVANADATRVKAQVTDLQEQGRTLNAVLEQSTKAVESERLAHEAIVQKLKEADHEKAEARRVSETNLRKELEEVNSRVLDLVARGNEIESTLERERERHTVEVAELRNL